MLTIQLFTFNPLAENTYILHNDAGECIITDPGCYAANERLALANLIAANRWRPKYLLNTHCHLDHIFGNKFVSEQWKLEPYIHSLEQPVLESAAMAGLHWGLPFDNYAGPVHFLRANDTIRLGVDELKVLFTPGHSPGHICFYSAAQQFLIGGDVLFKSGIGRTDLPGGDYDTLLQSIRTQLFVLPDETVVYPGHGASTTIGFEKATNPFLQDL